MDMPKEAPLYATTFMEGLREADVSIVAALPESLLGWVYRLCEADPAITYVPVSNEAEMPGVCAGAYLAGKKSLMIMENSGLRQACEAIARFSFCHHMPMLMCMSFRGDLGERNWWGHNHAQTMEPILNAMRIPYRIISKLEDVKPAIRKGLIHTDSSQWPVALAFTGECVQGGLIAKV